MPSSVKFNEVDPENPRALGQCDMSTQVVFHDQLERQMAYQGATLRWTGTLRRPEYIDKPQGQDARIQLRPDPVPVKYPRPER